MNRTTLPSRMTIIGLVFLLAIIAFEIFNFDTTRFALNHLLRNQTLGRAGSVSWAAVLAIAFCGIDFAGLIHIFTSHLNDRITPQHIWYLMGAWLLGATLNAIMTWYAVSVTLLETPIANGVMSQAELLKVVPIFVAFLVWLTRILFVAALAMMGSALLPFLSNAGASPRTATRSRKAEQSPIRIRPRPVRETVTRDESVFRPTAPPSSNGVPVHPATEN